ncbi:MAG: response regulator transcription factor [Acidobacteria bacterium]|nr:response regulator transcription factor [Acidobacteriota bacterium]MBI3422720.1 response regulator transcription factor [Acidobacteriota bacterium]
MNREIRLLVADDHPIFRQGLKQVIERDAQLKVVAEADDGEAALVLLRDCQAEIAILDLDMPRLDGFGVARRLRETRSPVKVIFLTMHKDALHFNEALEVGALGYLIKDSVAADVVNCIRSVASGQPYISPALSGLLLERSRRNAALTQEQPGLQTLTATERCVLALLAEYKTSKEIANDLGVSTRTIENHRANICVKLELHGAHALVKFALQHKAELS